MSPLYSWLINWRVRHIALEYESNPWHSERKTYGEEMKKEIGSPSIVDLAIDVKAEQIHR